MRGRKIKKRQGKEVIFNVDIGRIISLRGCYISRIKKVSNRIRFVSGLSKNSEGNFCRYELTWEKRAQCIYIYIYQSTFMEKKFWRKGFWFLLKKLFEFIEWPWYIYIYIYIYIMTLMYIYIYIYKGHSFQKIIRIYWMTYIYIYIYKGLQ